jgi:hypothetical protein
VDNMLPCCFIYQAIEQFIEFRVEGARLFEALYIFGAICLCGVISNVSTNVRAEEHIIR